MSINLYLHILVKSIITIKPKYSYDIPGFNVLNYSQNPAFAFDDHLSLGSSLYNSADLLTFIYFLHKNK